MQCAGAARLEGIKAFEGTEECVLNQVVGVGQVTGPLRKPAGGPAPKRPQMAREQPVDRLLVPASRAVDQMDGGFEVRIVRRGGV